MISLPSRTVVLACATALAVAVAGTAFADSPPVGVLPAGPTSTIETQRGQLVAFALPQRADGRVWRIARPFKATVVVQVSEASVRKSTVLVFRAVGPGTATVSFGLTRGETSKAYESRRFVIHVR